MKITAMLTLLAALILNMAGCSFSKSAVHQSININKSVAEGDNKIMMLNVLRAYKHMPPVFTSLSNIHSSSPSEESSLNFSIPFGGDADNSYGFTPGIRSSHSLSYDIAVFQSEEFMRAILNPIKPETFKYYWDQGWPKHLLLNLFVEEIRFYHRNKDNTLSLRKRFENYPIDSLKYNNFSREMHYLIQDSLDVVLKEKYEINVDGKLAKIKDIETPLISNTVCFVKSDTLKNKVKYNSYTFNNKYQITLPPEIKDFSEKVRKLHPDLVECKDLAVLYLRSPESILYYLGEIVRSKLEKNYDTKVLSGRKEDPIFVVRPESQSESNNSLLSVDFEDVKYIVPSREESGRTMEVISLLNQLIGQTKSSKDLPQTSTIRFIP